ncbi:ATP-dependent RNA helicase DHX33 [Thrips palmi]|uniref:RNA helicase n=1 Tax=Thrips palmi TaxID=161013 RepID=A0A6P8ZGX3_THRPL|nr:ATP-dependent RNA helicase DHX33 [Thrips palmi]XP_034230854.1 ATP-dependent RNA helicase DHX33 [Thrips palmi]
MADMKMMNSPNPFIKKKRPAVVNFHQNVSDFISPKKQKRENMPGLISADGSQQKPNLVRPGFMQDERKKLPIFAVRPRLVEEIQKNDTLIVIGETGCGKTTQIPQFIHESKLGKDGIIAITQPRRVAAVSLSKRVAKEMNVPIGDTVGYTIRFEDVTTEKTKLKYMTDGMLFREALLDELLMKYTVIILDEAHERSINTDVLFGIVKKAQRLRAENAKSPLKVIIMSATMDVDHFSKYFNNAKVLYLEGRQYPVTVLNAKQPQNDYIQSCLSTIFQIHLDGPPGDILVFLTGQDEIEGVAHTVRLAAKECKQTLRTLPLYSAMPMQMMENVFRPTPPNERKVILSTNVAETSLTIPGIKYVIDSGHVKARVYQPNTGLDLLKVQKVSQEQSWQRTGRAGRESAGTCYRVFTKEQFNELPKFTTPEILRCNLASVMLQLLHLGVDAYDFDFMDKPSQEALDAAVSQLKMLGAIESQETRKLTSLGSKMAQFPLDPRLSKILISSKTYNCTEEILTIVALLSGESVFLNSLNNREEATERHKKFFSSEGDHITLLNVYHAFNSFKTQKKTCAENYLNYRNLVFASDVRKQLAQICEQNKIPLSSCGQNTELVRKCLISGYFMNVAELQREKKYILVESKQRVRIHPSSVLHRTLPHYILFSEVVHTSQAYIRQLSIVDPELLNEVAPNYFRQHRLGTKD